MRVVGAWSPGGCWGSWGGVGAASALRAVDEVGWELGWGGVGVGAASSWRTVMDEVEGLKSSGSSLTPPPAGVGGFVPHFLY